jgi:hypothetical protein
MATAFVKNALKCHARHKTCKIKYAAKFQQKCCWKITTSFVSFTLCWCHCTLIKLFGAFRGGGFGKDACSAKVYFWSMAVQWYNEGKSAASFCLQVTARVPDMFCNFYLVKKSQNSQKNSTTTKEKISTYLESLQLWEYFDVCLTKFKKNQILLNKVIHRILLTTKLFTGWKILNRFPVIQKNFIRR